MSSSSEEKKQQDLYYESNRYQEREFCRECGSTSVYTRVYFHETTHHSRWLCYCCADDYVQYRGYKLLTVPLVITSSVEEKK
jgi:hypothetical protein